MGNMKEELKGIKAGGNAIFIESEFQEQRKTIKQFLKG